MQYRRFSGTLRAALLLSAAGTCFLSAPAAQAAAIKTNFEYAAKVVCSALGTFGDGFLAEGIYRTVVNIHNPSDKEITFVRKVAIAGPVGDPASDISVTPFKSATLGPDGAAQIDCGGILGFFCPTADGLCFDFSALDGFLVIKSPVELDVVALYTARPRDAQVATMDVETIRARKAKKTIDVAEETAPPEIKQRIRKETH